MSLLLLLKGLSMSRRPEEKSCRLQCRMTEDGSMAQLCTYARIDTVEIPFSGDLMDSWEDPTSFFLMDGAACHPSCHHNHELTTASVLLAQSLAGLHAFEPRAAPGCCYLARGIMLGVTLVSHPFYWRSSLTKVTSLQGVRYCIGE